MRCTLKEVLPLCVELAEEGICLEGKSSLVISSNELRRMNRRLTCLQEEVKKESFNPAITDFLADDLSDMVQVHRSIGQVDSFFTLFVPKKWDKELLLERGSVGIDELINCLPICIELAKDHVEALMFSREFIEAQEFRALIKRLRFLRRTLNEEGQLGLPEADWMKRESFMLSAAYLHSVATRRKYADLCPTLWKGKVQAKRTIQIATVI